MSVRLPGSGEVRGRFLIGSSFALPLYHGDRTREDYVQAGAVFLVIPRYNAAHRLTLGKSVVRFTPTEAGTVPFTCSMGARMGQFTVIH